MMMQEWHPLSNPTKENREGGGGIRKETAFDESRKDTPDRVARYHTD